MKYSITILALAFLGLAAAALAESERKTKTTIAVVSDDGSDETRVELDGDELDFNLDDMQVGENRSVVDKNGQPILITREADGFKLEVDGKTVRIPEIHGDVHNRHHGAVWIGHGEDADVDVQVMRNIRVKSVDGIDGITILSGEPIDDATQQAIKSVLESAGHGSEVRFIDHEAGDGEPYHVKIVHKRVEVSE